MSKEQIPTETARELSDVEIREGLVLGLIVHVEREQVDRVNGLLITQHETIADLTRQLDAAKERIGELTQFIGLLDDQIVGDVLEDGLQVMRASIAESAAMPDGGRG